jgi:hypothetical protein
MALTTEQQAMLDIQTATETLRHNNQMIIMTAQMKLDAIRLAQQTLVENARSKPADEREITPADIAAFANALVAATNA